MWRRGRDVPGAGGLPGGGRADRAVPPAFAAAAASGRGRPARTARLPCG